MDVIFWLVKIQNLNKTVRKKNYLVKNKFVLTLGETSPHLHKIDFFFFYPYWTKKKKNQNQNDIIFKIQFGEKSINYFAEKQYDGCDIQSTCIFFQSHFFPYMF